MELSNAVQLPVGGVEEVQAFKRTFDADLSPDWSELTKEIQQRIVAHGRFQSKTWNFFDDGLKDFANFKIDAAISNANKLIKFEMKDCKHHLMRATVLSYLASLGSNHLMDIIRFYFYSDKLKLAKPPRLSGEAMKTNVSSAAVTNVLQADKIRGGMFRGKFDEKSFERFTFPGSGNSTQDGSEFSSIISPFLVSGAIDDSRKDLLSIQFFLETVASGDKCSESTTQFMFQLFLGIALRRMDGDTAVECVVLGVTGMSPIMHHEHVCRRYMVDQKVEAQKKKNEALDREEVKKNIKKGMDVQISIKSDLSIYRKKHDEEIDCKSATTLRRIFVEGLVNIEMKRFGMLFGAANRGPATQVALESMVKSQERGASCPPRIFSLLTDGHTIYVLVHEVDTVGADKKGSYKISRSVLDPQKFVEVIYWVLLVSAGKLQFDEAAFAKWIHDAADGKEEQGEGQGQGRAGQRDQDSDDGDNTSVSENDTGSPDHKRSRQEPNDSDNAQNVIILDWDDDDDQVDYYHEAQMMLSHAQLGQSVPLSEYALKLHTNREKSLSMLDRLLSFSA